MGSQGIYESANRAADKKSDYKKNRVTPFESRLAVHKREKMLLKQEICNIKEQLQQPELKLLKPELKE